MIRTGLLLPVALAACGAAGDPRPSQADGASTAPAGCALTVAFGSYAMGIDRATLQSVEARLAADRSVLAVERSARGREGELTLCVRTRSVADSERLHREIAASFPAEPRGPLSVATRSGLVAHTPPR